MTSLEIIKNRLIDRILAVKNEKLLEAIEKIIVSNDEEEEISFTSEQIEMLMMSEQDIKYGRIVSEFEMDSIRIEILNPKARKLLKNLAELKLIRISDSPDRKNEFKKLLKNLRAKSDKAPSLDEIAKEVDSVRKERYDKEN